MVRLISRLLGAFAIGVILSVWIIQRNEHVQKAVTTKLLNLLEKEWNSKISAENTNINFFTCSATLCNASIKSLAHKNCFWRVKEAKIYVSPIAYLFDNAIKLTLTLKEVDAVSGISQNSFELKEHIQTLLNAKNPTSNIGVHSLHIINAKFEFQTPTNHRIKLDINGRFDLEEPHSFKQTEKIWNGHIRICGGQIFWDDNKFIKNFVLNSNFKKGNLTTPFKLTADGSFKTCLIEGLPKYQLHAEFSENKLLLINNEANKVSLSAKQLAGSNNLQIDGTLPIELTTQTYQFFNQSPQALPAWLKQSKGTSSFNFDVIPTDQWKISQSNITLQNVDFQKINLDLLELRQIRYDGQNLSADLHSIVNKNFEFTGLIGWSRQSNTCDLSVSNTKPLYVEKTSWQIDANGCYIKAKIDHSGVVHGFYKTNIINREQKQKFNWQGDYKLTQQNLITNGKTQHGDYVVNANFLPTPHVTKWTYECKNKKIIDLNALPNNEMILDGMVRFALIRSWLSSSLKNSLAGKGCVLHLKVDQNNWLQPKGEIKLEDGKFYLPGNRNLITTFNSEFEINLHERELKMQKALIGFCKGQITCPQAVISLDENNSLKILHVPLQVNDLMVNWKRDLYAIVYGNLLVNKLPQKITTVSGDIILKASLLKESLLSGDSFGAYSTGGLGFTEAMSNLVFDIHITNEKPIKVKTQTLEANANLDLKVLYTQNNLGLTPPRITGTINLENGYLKFLKNKLAIETGRIQFLANQLNDPTIDLVARNKINKYMITLQTTGTLQKPTIILESNPDLTEEQILSLLLGGSETASLQTDLPAMLMQNMSTLVLGERKLKSQTNALFEKITRPLKYVQISPNFTDQSGRGGVKCVIPVDLNNQLHAQIQKNLNMQEDDWGLQVEYLLTDDINVKGVRDQRGEVGAEVEVRFKL